MVFKLLTTHHPRRTTQRGITLVEMLISMAVTLVMMAAVVNLFANIGTGVRNRRASMELGSQLRSARARLFKDLAGATCPVRPKLPSDDHDDGYFEIIEGQYSDKNPSALVQSINIDQVDGNNNPIGLQHATSLVPRDNSGRLVQWVDDDGDGIVDNGSEQNSVRSTGSALGDYDDILALTVRSESEPFKGRMLVWEDPDGPGGQPIQWVRRTIESDLAEVIWYAVENPADGSNGEPGMRTVYRRVLLIAPWVSELPPERSSTEPGKVIPASRTYYQLSDISMRREFLDPSNPATSDILRVPNTLADLSKRENRFGHFSGQGSFPHQINIRAIRNRPSTDRNNFPEFTPLDPSSVLIPFGLPFEWDQVEPFVLQDDDTSIPQFPPGTSDLGEDRKGEDVMLNDVLAFDLRVYDPEAPIIDFNGTAAGNVLEPSAAGWRHNPDLTAPTLQHPIVGLGAFVDLGYWRKYVEYATILGVPLPTQDSNGDSIPDNNNPSLFSEAPNPRSGIVLNAVDPEIYDTWPYHYETDGINQDEDFIDLGLTPNIDEGTNGLDDPEPSLFGDPLHVNLPQDVPINGVDDVSEREAPPPYDHPLRAMQAKIRVYDRESRQIREATVTRNFVPQ